MPSNVSLVTVGDVVFFQFALRCEQIIIETFCHRMMVMFKCNIVWKCFNTGKQLFLCREISRDSQTALHLILQFIDLLHSKLTEPKEIQFFSHLRLCTQNKKRTILSLRKEPMLHILRNLGYVSNSFFTKILPQEDLSYRQPNGSSRGAVLAPLFFSLFVVPGSLYVMLINFSRFELFTECPCQRQSCSEYTEGNTGPDYRATT